jgi:hypothetical protein
MTITTDWLGDQNREAVNFQGMIKTYRMPHTPACTDDKQYVIYYPLVAVANWMLLYTLEVLSLNLIQSGLYIIHEIMHIMYNVLMQPSRGHIGPGRYLIGSVIF